MLYLSREEAAQLHKVSLPTIDKWIRQGGDHFVVEYGGNGRAYKIDPDKLQAWRTARLAEEEAVERKRAATIQQMELLLTGGSAETDPDGKPLNVEQRIKLVQEQLLREKLARERGTVVTAEAAQATFEQTLAFVGEFLKRLPDVMGRRLGWPTATIEACAEHVEAVQEALARALQEGSFLDVGDT